MRRRAAGAARGPAQHAEQQVTVRCWWWQAPVFRQSLSINSFVPCFISSAGPNPDILCRNHWLRCVHITAACTSATAVSNVLLCRHWDVLHSVGNPSDLCTGVRLSYATPRGACLAAVLPNLYQPAVAWLAVHPTLARFLQQFLPELLSNLCLADRQRPPQQDPSWRCTRPRLCWPT